MMAKLKNLQEEFVEYKKGLAASDEDEGNELETEEVTEFPAQQGVETLQDSQSQCDGQIIGFMSGKGGVGKTGLAINVANFCAENNDKVLLVDCDLSTSGATTFFGQRKVEEYYFAGTVEPLLYTIFYLRR